MKGGAYNTRGEEGGGEERWWSHANKGMVMVFRGVGPQAGAPQAKSRPFPYWHTRLRWLRLVLDLRLPDLYSPTRGSEELIMHTLGGVVLPLRPAPLIASIVNPVCSQHGRSWTKHKTYGIRFGQNGTTQLASTPTAVNFPCDYEELMQQVRDSSKAALSDSKKLLEIEFPTAGLDSVSGDAEGGIEMTSSIQLIRKFAQSLVLGDKSAALRIFFPDSDEVEIARKGEFEATRFQLDYLTKPSGLEDFGLGGFAKKLKMSDRVKPSDEMYIVAYPYFNVNEMLAVEELFQNSAEATGRPIIIFNGELDRIRSGYYPPFFYPKLAQLAKSFLPKFETAYYIHNFKGRDSGTLFRAYPGPWQVLQRAKDGKYVTVHEQSTMPPLKEVALDILPASKVKQVHVGRK